jgi:hypothetical protein
LPAYHYQESRRVEYGPTGGIRSTSMTYIFLFFCTAEDSDVRSMFTFLLLSGAGDSILPGLSVADAVVDLSDCLPLCECRWCWLRPKDGIYPAIPLSGDSYVSCGLLSKSLV